MILQVRPFFFRGWHGIPGVVVASEGWDPQVMAIQPTPQRTPPRKMALVRGLLTIGFP